MAKVFTQEEIEALGMNPHVKNVRNNRLTLTYEFRLILWNEWAKNPSVSTIRKILEFNGFDCNMFGAKYIYSLHLNFKRYGKPSGATNKILGENALSFKTNKIDNDFLVSTGKFIKNGEKGIKFHPNFVQEIYHTYPEVTIEEKLKEYDIDPEIVGYQRIYQLKQILDGNGTSSIKSCYDDNVVCKYVNHPYIKRINSHQLSFNDHFYNETQIFKEFHIDQILSIFEVNYHDLTVSRKNNIKYKINHWNHEDIEPVNEVSSIMIKINTNKIEAMMNMIDNHFKLVKESVPSMSPLERKELCSWIDWLPKDRYSFTVQKILKAVGVSKTNYYHIIGSETYAQSCTSKDIQDSADVELIKKVLNSEKYPMGSRMVYMKMKEITGIQFGRNKIMRLMKKYGLLCKVRKSNTSRQAMKQMLDENCKPNLLKRQFRFNKPLTTFLTDVTYLKFGNNQTAYKSTIKDASSGKIISCVVSNSNDLILADDTIENLNQIQVNNAALFHSDQGTLYLNPSFQLKLKKMGFIQSMSRRGNCWDNASQESYFGHFKDECIFRDCSTVEEVQKMVDEYIDYYNYRRPQWTRNKMTPDEYEKYLLSMSDEDFQKYSDNERQKYDTMMAKAKENALKRAKDIGA